MNETTPQALDALFRKQKAAFARDPMPGLEDRLQRLRSLCRAVAAYREPLRRAVAEDFGTRNPLLTDLFESGGVIGRAQFIQSQLAEWMAPEVREIDPRIHGSSKVQVIRQPKGVLGNISPWNFPIDSALVMVADMLAAGNRVIIKPSEFTPATAEVLEAMIAAHFPEDVLTVVTGGAEFGAYFASLPWSHLTFTGSTRVGRLVMRAAANNLTPVTLELGGKNPALFAHDGVEPAYVDRFLYFRSFNAGQVCTSPDYALVPAELLGRWVSLAKEAWTLLYPRYVGHPDANSIITKAHFERLLSLVNEARARGVEVVSLNGEEPAAQQRHFPMMVVVDPPDDLVCMREEVFGPVIPVKSYRSIDEAIDRINSGPNPLSAYIVTRDMDLAERFAAQVLSGGTGVNTFGFQCIEPSAPFGGVGASGMGCHSGREGFLNYSHTKTVFYQSDDNPLSALLRPPFGEAMRELADEVYRGIE